VTDVNGRATASFITTDLALPSELRSILSPKIASGWVYVKVLDLLPDEWANLEVIVRTLKSHRIGEGSALLYVRYWEPPKQLTFNMKSRFTFDGGGIYKLDGTVSAVVPLQMKQEVDPITGQTNILYEGQSTENYESFTWTYLPGGAGSGCIGTVNRLTGDSISVRIPVGSCDGSGLVVQVRPGKPSENVTLACPDPAPPPSTLTLNWWQGAWEILHASELAPHSNRYYNIKSWTQGTSPNVLSKQSNNTSANYAEDTTLTLEVSP
jgi:hypothetical protein